MTNVKKKAPIFEKKSKLKKDQRSVLSDTIEKLRARHETIDSASVDKFQDYPLSQHTLKALQAAGFSKPTEIQSKVLQTALLGHDLVAEAVTGSGKTLAFLIPMLECLYLNQITPLDGNVALVLTPTRELAHQIFAVLQKLAKFHQFSYIDVMGGRQSSIMRSEWEMVGQANIVIATPGRMAQHYLENATLHMSNFKMLILDEADRLLDPTFASDLQSILENLPEDKQIMLFSATQRKSLGQLSRLGLKSPKILSTITEHQAANRTPNTLIQHYCVVRLENKLDFLWSFLLDNNRRKILVFFSTQKQVRFVTDLFKQLKPLYTVHQLRGNMRQDKRFGIFDKFTSCREGSVLFTTNVSERGLDFPQVDWVVQYDPPKCMDDYVHRVGRTARCGQKGKSLLMLLESELSMVDQLPEGTVSKFAFPQEAIYQTVTKKAPVLLASQPDMSASARLAFTAFLRDYCFRPKEHKNKKATGQSEQNIHFKPADLDVVALAASYGLPQMPPLPELFCQITGQKNFAIEHSAKNRIVFDDLAEDDQDDGDDFMVRKSAEDTPTVEPEQTNEQEQPRVSKKALKKHRISHEVVHIKFDQKPAEEEEAIPLTLDQVKEQLKEHNVADKEKHRALIRERHRKERLKRKLERKRLEAEKGGSSLASETASTNGDEEDEEDEISETGTDEQDSNSEEDSDAYDAGSDVVSEYEEEDLPASSDNEEPPSKKCK